MYEFYFPLPEGEERVRVARLSHSCQNPQWHFALHIHPHETELLYVAGGRAVIEVGSRRLEVEGGDILLVEAGTPHASTSDPQDPSDIWSLSLTLADAGVGERGAVCARAGEDAPFVHAALLQLQRLAHRLDPETQDLCDRLGEVLLGLYRERLSCCGGQDHPRESGLARSVLAYLDAHYQEHIDLKTLEARFFVSAGHISREFRKEYCISPINYLIDKRLSQAKWLLINTQEPIQFVAESVGYDNVYYFSKLFAEKVGAAPSDYRRTFASERGSTGGGNGENA